MITIYLKQHNKIIRNADIEIFDSLGFDDILWIDLLSPTIKEQKAVEEFMDIDLLSKQEAEVHSAQCIQYINAVLLVKEGVSCVYKVKAFLVYSAVLAHKDDALVCFWRNINFL